MISTSLVGHMSVLRNRTLHALSFWRRLHQYFDEDLNLYKLVSAKYSGIPKNLEGSFLAELSKVDTQEFKIWFLCSARPFY